MVHKPDLPISPSDGGEPNPEEKKRLMEQAQEDAAQERESEGGYQ
jgi:hypothetical protein